MRLDESYRVSGARKVRLREGGSDLRLLAALVLFREQRISSGKAAQVAGLSKAELIDELGRRGIPYFTETPEELERQMENLRELLSGS